MNYDDWNVKLENHLSKFDLNETKWENIKKNLKIGEIITGTVICRAHFGAWIDVNQEFPALLEIIFIKELTPSNYKAGKWMEEGTDVEAYITGFRDGNRQIYLSQESPKSQV